MKHPWAEELLSAVLSLPVWLRWKHLPKWLYGCRVASIQAEWEKEVRSMGMGGLREGKFAGSDPLNAKGACRESRLPPSPYFLLGSRDFRL